MRKLIAKTDSNDDRVALVAMQAILDRAWGKPRDYDPKSAQAGALRIDVGKLTSEQRQLLLSMIRRGGVKQAASADDTDITTVDATATETRPA